MPKALAENQVRLGAVVLAAGCSRRMGRHKMLLPWEGRTIVRDVVGRVARVVRPVTVVVGHEHQAVRDSLGGIGGVDVVYNPRYADGEMISSVKVGVGALPESCDAFFIVLGDQPGIHDSVFERLVATWMRTRAHIISPTHRGKRGHPILLSGQCIGDLLQLPADRTLKTYIAFQAQEHAEVEVDDPAVLADLDTPEQYQRLIQNGSLSCRTEAKVAAAAAD